MITARFITETYLKKETPITANVEVTDILPFIDMAQDIDVQEVLGSKLYRTLMAAVSANTVTSDQGVLLGHVMKVQAYYATYRALPFVQNKLRNKGVMEGTSEHANTVDLERMRWIRNEMKNMGEYYVKRLQDYLCENGHLFPDYVQADNPLYPNARVAFDCDLTLDEYGGCCGETDFRDFFRRYLS